ncbi:MAG: thioredoxin [Hyphomicrobiales bacterium]|nr:MAG: thioredoxin [Hyphomicrobiales bacterium]
MNISRRGFHAILAGAAALPLIGAGAARGSEAPAGGEPAKGDDGLYTQDWFADTFLNLGDDAMEAAGEKKHLAVLWEQNGCPYCREMHKVNLAIPQIRDYIKANFTVLQLDLWGPRKATDFDGKEMGERELARRWNVNFTPTICFFPQLAKIPEGKSGKDLEVMRMPGYFKPFHFLSMFEYVQSGKYETMPFQRFVQARGDMLREEGKPVKLW